MPYTVTQFETTPNPNAIKCWLDRPICRGSRGFRTAESAAAHPVARALFERAGATGVLLLDDWLTVNKPEATSWPTMKRRIRRVLADALDSPDASDSANALNAPDEIDAAAGETRDDAVETAG